MLDKLQKRLQQTELSQRERPNLPINPQAKRVSNLVQQQKSKGPQK